MRTPIAYSTGVVIVLAIFNGITAFATPSKAQDIILICVIAGAPSDTVPPPPELGISIWLNPPRVELGMARSDRAEIDDASIRFWISDLDRRYPKEETAFTLDRGTGALTWSYDKDGVHIHASGQCAKARLEAAPKRPHRPVGPPNRPLPL